MIIITGKVKDVKFDDIHVGDKASLTKSFNSNEVYEFAKISLDCNPIHVDEEFAQSSMFKHRIVHGALTNSLISAVLGTELPGINTIYMSQSTKFLAPVMIDDTLTATVECISKDDEKHRIVFRTFITNQDGKVVVDGEAKVMKK
ncbi:MAG: MaoC family dehydratase [Firmicutes bacterium]|nr:MaoC family dehydratase [Bacillota bacterium]